RGVAIMIMVWVHFMMFFSHHALFLDISDYIVHGALTHAGPFSAPFFYIMSGMSLTIATKRRRAKNINGKRIRNHVIKRGALVILFGYLFSFIRVFWIFRPDSIINFLFFWDLLHSLGLLMILTFFCLKLSIRKRLIILGAIIGATFLIGYIPLLFGAPEPTNTLFYLWEGVDYYYEKNLWSWTFLIQGNIGLLIIDFLMQIFWYGNYPVIPWISFTIFGTILAETLLKYAEIGDDLGLAKKIIQYCLVFLGLATLIFFLTNIPLTNPWIIPWELTPATYCFFCITITTLFTFGIFWTYDFKRRPGWIFSPAEHVGRIPLTIYFISQWFSSLYA
ncbi:MAG: heparan-alpha-glucosaminide N-acetyltransferase domain-containing protein, partial [Candidatus Helarchaeota archaeon]